MWANRVFHFLITVTEVNCDLINSDYYEEDLEDQIEFRYKLGNEMIKHAYLNNTDK